MGPFFRHLKHVIFFSMIKMDRSYKYDAICFGLPRNGMYKKDVAPCKRDGKICSAMNAPRSFISVVYVE
jgi:hypothetical protein